MGFTIEEGQESYPLFSPASHCPLTVRTLETSGPNRDPRTDAARILQEHLPAGAWFRLPVPFTLECSAARPGFLSVLVLWRYKTQNLLFYLSIGELICIMVSHCCRPASRKKLLKQMTASSSIILLEPMESRLTRFLSSFPDLGELFGPPVVRCVTVTRTETVPEVTES